jgi:hypothetical protein
MNAVDDLLPPQPVAGDGVALFDALVVAVRFLRRGARPTLTVWAALDEALRWQSNRDIDLAAADPLAISLTDLLSIELDTSDGLANAINGWLDTTAQTFNDGAAWTESPACP